MGRRGRSGGIHASYTPPLLPPPQGQPSSPPSRIQGRGGGVAKLPFSPWGLGMGTTVHKSVLGQHGIPHCSALRVCCFLDVSGWLLLPSALPTRSIAASGRGALRAGVWKTGSKGRTLFSPFSPKKRVLNRICQIDVQSHVSQQFQMSCGACGGPGPWSLLW